MVGWSEGRDRGQRTEDEEETKTSEFSIYRLAHYCLDLAELMETDRVVPVVIFLRAGDNRTYLRMGQRFVRLYGVSIFDVQAQKQVVCRIL